MAHGDPMKCRIAELNVELHASGRTAVQAQPYAAEWEGEADLTLRADGERALACHPELETADLAEYLASGEYFAMGLLHFDGVMLHSSAVEYAGECVCFSAPPGVGKSTMTARWERLFGAEILNDDKPALRCVDGRWMAFGTPWSGKHDKSRSAGAPVKAICFLFRGEENTLTPLTAAEALPLFLSQTVFRLDKAGMDRLLALADRLLREVPVYRITCRNDDSAASFARKALFDQP